MNNERREAMNETFWIIAEVFVGAGVLGLLSAVITAIMVPLLSKYPETEEILRKRYARGELTREQYAQIRQDLANGAAPDIKVGPPIALGGQR
jgi:uncharacterized membrane protein